MVQEYINIQCCCTTLALGYNLVPGILSIKGLHEPKSRDSCKYVMDIRFHKNVHIFLVIQERCNLSITKSQEKNKKNN